MKDREYYESLLKSIDKDKFFKNIILNETTNCWNWNSDSVMGRGYGYIYVGNKKYERAHRISYLLVNETIDPSLGVLHKCGNPKCINPEHLYQGTCKDNVEDSRIHGTMTVGEASKLSILTDEIVKSIRKEFKESKVTQRELAKRYNISFQSISKAIIGVTWKHVK